MQFDARKLRGDKVSNDFREKIVQRLDIFKNTIFNVVSLFNESMQIYRSEMQNAVEKTETYFPHPEFLVLQQTLKETIVNEVI